MPIKSTGMNCHSEYNYSKTNCHNNYNYGQETQRWKNIDDQNNK